MFELSLKDQPGNFDCILMLLKDTKSVQIETNSHLKRWRVTFVSMALTLEMKLSNSKLDVHMTV